MEVFANALFEPLIYNESFTKCGTFLIKVKPDLSLRLIHLKNKGLQFMHTFILKMQSVLRSLKHF
jgi:hypothetical protein